MDKERVGEAQKHERHRRMKLRVKVLYFARARDLAASDGESVDVEDGSTVDDLSSELIRLHPPLRRLDRSVRYSVNLELVGRGTVLRESDVVGVLPPVAGG